MNTSILYPPNHHSLSDTIINDFPAIRPPVSRAPRRSTVRSTYSISRGSRNPKSVRQRRTKRTEIERKLIHRERCRLNQIRYREQQMKTTRDLEEAILKLQGEIKSLEAQKRPTSRVLTMWSVAVEYFRQFNHFLHCMGENRSSAVDFLCGMLAPDVVECSITGAEALVDKWRLFSLFFEDVKVELNDLNTLTANTLVARTVIHATITEATLQAVFPNSFSGGEKGVQFSPLGKLVGQRVVMRGVVRFDWDNVHKRVEAIDCSADILTPLLRVLGNLQDVSRLFNKALLSPDCRFMRNNM